MLLFCFVFVLSEENVFVLFVSMGINFSFPLLLVCPGSSSRYVFYGKTPKKGNWANTTQLKDGFQCYRCGRYVLIIHFYVESGQKLIQFNIQFKIESKIFIQKIIHSNWKNKFKKLFNSKLNQKYSFKLEK